MKTSVYTPTHKPKYLAELLACLRNQTHQDWEWVVVPNGMEYPAITEHLKQLAADDKRIKIFPYTNCTSSVGFLKKFACSKATGDLLVEVDHDDVITEDCLEQLVTRATANPNAGFFYSDSVTCSFSGASQTFLRDYGWRQYQWQYKGKMYEVNKSFPVNARSVCEILYAPDHVRAWTREAYDKAGGYNESFALADDHELMIRTYLAGIECEHIQKPLYLHRLDNQTTSQTNLPEIGRISNRLCDKNLHPLVKEWCRRESLPMIDLGGAHDCPAGYIPLDRDLSHASDTFIKIRNDRVWPKQFGGDVFTTLDAMPDDSVGCFRAYDFLEHIAASQMIEFMNLLYAKLVPGGFLLSHTPAICDDQGKAGRGAFQDPDHKSFWSSNNTWYFTNRDQAKYHNGAICCRFQNVRLANWYPNDWHATHLLPYLVWDAMALKDDDGHYYPGYKNI